MTKRESSEGSRRSPPSSKKRPVTSVVQRSQSAQFASATEGTTTAHPAVSDGNRSEGRRGTQRQQRPFVAAIPPRGPITYPAPLAISLSGCGFLCSYHIGAMICFQRHAQALLSHVNFYCGASAGALIASLLVLAPNSLETGLRQLYALAREVQRSRFGALTPGFNMAQRLAGIVDAFIPSDITPANGRLIISVTRQRDHTNRLVGIYSSREFLLQCLNATCYIPYYSSSDPPTIDGECYIDGVYSNNLPIPDGVPLVNTITVSPFSGGAIISPRDRKYRLFDWQMTLGQQRMNVNIKNVVRGARSLFPQSVAQLTELYGNGYRDAMLYLLRKGYYERGEGTEV